MFAQLASMILRGVREFDEAARETASSIRPHQQHDANEDVDEEQSPLHESDRGR